MPGAEDDNGLRPRSFGIVPMNGVRGANLMPRGCISPPLGVAEGLRGALDQLEDNDHQDDDDQHTNYGPQPWGHCVHLL